MDHFFLLNLLRIIWIDILLSGDNALVIAMACRALPERQRFWGMVLGAGAAITLRIFFTSIIAYVLAIPYLKLVGGCLLAWVAIKLMLPEDDEKDEKPPPASLYNAIIVIVIADMVMSLDNIIAVAAASNGNILLLSIGLLISIPLIVTGAALIVKLLNQFPFLVIAGSALLAWIAGGVIASDPLMQRLDPEGFIITLVTLGLVMVYGLLLRYAKVSDA